MIEENWKRIVATTNPWANFRIPPHQSSEPYVNVVTGSLSKAIGNDSSLFFASLQVRVKDLLVTVETKQ
ncbi:164_t:CDS:2 [Ambispora leptoticha]|uniref:164_t:CDS:1 n=1 Tax=Ambispora leptoticha TaxID=144679 RepID=A0A9N9CHA2_9GLOM|nr:164_t:CDS:2 [Ambispora leptoticha]